MRLEKYQASETPTFLDDQTEESDAVPTVRPIYPLPEEHTIEVNGRKYRSVVTSHDAPHNSVTSTHFILVDPSPYNWGD